MKNEIISAVEELNEEKVLNLVRFALRKGEEPADILEALQTGMVNVGSLYENKKYYLADLIMAGIIFKEVLSMNEMRLTINSKTNSIFKPKILIGTVQDDLHDIGKEIFAGVAIASGFEVIDIGVDISPERFIEKYLEFSPDIIGISGVLTQSVQRMKQIVALFVEKGLRDNVKIIIGGSPINKESCKYIGADAFALQVKDGIKICREWFEEIQKHDGVNTDE